MKLREDRTCIMCGVETFKCLVGSKRKTCCTECSREYETHYRKTSPKVHARLVEYRNKPENKLRQQIYQRTYREKQKNT